MTAATTPLTPPRPQPLSRPQYDDYVRRVDLACDLCQFEDIAGVLGTLDPRASTLREMLAHYPPELIGEG